MRWLARRRLSDRQDRGAGALRLSEFHQILTGALKPPSADCHRCRDSKAARGTASSQPRRRCQRPCAERAIGPFEAELQVIGSLPARLREGAVLRHRRIGRESAAGFRARRHRDRSFAVAVDVGTTTLAAALVDLASVVRNWRSPRSSTRRRGFGDDVLTRIQMAAGDGGLARLQSSVLEAIDRLIESLAASAGIQRADLRGFVCGQYDRSTCCAAWIHALSARYLLYRPCGRAAVSARELPLKIHQSGRAYVFAGDRRLCGRRHGGGNADDGPGRSAGADPAGGRGNKRRDCAFRASEAVCGGRRRRSTALRGRARSRMACGPVPAIERVTFDGTLAIETIGHSAPRGCADRRHDRPGCHPAGLPGRQPRGAFPALQRLASDYPGRHPPARVGRSPEPGLSTALLNSRRPARQLC